MGKGNGGWDPAGDWQKITKFVEKQVVKPVQRDVIKPAVKWTGSTQGKQTIGFVANKIVAPAVAAGGKVVGGVGTAIGGVGGAVGNIGKGAGSALGGIGKGVGDLLNPKFLLLGGGMVLLIMLLK